MAEIRLDIEEGSMAGVSDWQKGDRFSWAGAEWEIMGEPESSPMFTTEVFKRTDAKSTHYLYLPALTGARKITPRLRLGQIWQGESNGDRFLVYRSETHSTAEKDVLRLINEHTGVVTTEKLFFQNNPGAVMVRAHWQGAP